MAEEVQVIDRLLDVLEYLSLTRNPKGPTEIAEAVGLNKSTVHRLLTSLYRRGYVEKDEVGGTYRIGLKLVEIVSNHIDNLELQTEARPILNDLHDTLGLVVHLGILDHHEVIYVEKMDISPNPRRYIDIGMRVPAQCSSLGKCLLSRMSGEQLEFTMSKCNFQRYTPNSITSLPRLREHLRMVRRRNWAMDNEEYIVGNRCVGAPVYDYRGEIIAAVSASGPVSLLTDQRLPEVVRHVQHAASTISHRLCYADATSDDATSWPEALVASLTN